MPYETGVCDAIKGVTREERKAEVQKWFDTKSIPTHEVRKGDHWPLGTARINECVNSYKVRTYGVDDYQLMQKSEDLLKTSRMISEALNTIQHMDAKNLTPKSMNTIIEAFELQQKLKSDFRFTAINKRDKKFVYNTIADAYMNSGDTGYIVPLIVGGLHKPGVTQELKNHDVSYVVIQNPGCEVSSKSIYR